MSEKLSEQAVNFDDLAKTVATDARTLLQLETHKLTDPIRYGQEDTAAERSVGEKIKSELDPIIGDQNKFRQFAAAAQSLKDSSLPYLDVLNDETLEHNPLTLSYSNTDSSHINLGAELQICRVPGTIWGASTEVGLGRGYYVSPDNKL